MDFITTVKAMLPVVQFLVTSGTGIGMIYALAKFTQKPTDTIKQRIADLEDRVDDMEQEQKAWQSAIERRLKDGAEHFKALDESNKITQQALLALMDNALGNDGGKEELKKARNNLFEYLSER